MSNRCRRSPIRLARPLLAILVKEALVMIAGVVTTRHVLLHSATIVHDFGLRLWLNCCRAVLTNQRTTFLELVWQR